PGPPGLRAPAPAPRAVVAARHAAPADPATPAIGYPVVTLPPPRHSGSNGHHARPAPPTPYPPRRR
ncbi:MAG: hypothetical protein ACT4RN_21550, partial [Pseudonocardia sp.]